MSETMVAGLILVLGAIGVGALVWMGVSRRRAKAATEALILFALALLMACLVAYGVMFGANPWGGPN